MPTEINFSASQHRQARLAQALHLTPAEAACQQCLAHLDDYIAAQLGGEDYLARWPEVAAHLDGCLNCAEDYSRLYAVEWAAATETLLDPGLLPTPDLSFLLPEAAGPLSPAALRARLKLAALAEQLGPALQRLGQRFRLQLTPSLLPLLQPAPAPTRTSDPDDELLLSLEPEQLPEMDLPLTLAVYRDKQQPEHCLIDLLIQPPERTWPDLAGIQVTLRAAGQEQQATTDAWGAVSFMGIPISDLAHLVVEFET